MLPDLVMLDIFCVRAILERTIRMRGSLTRVGTEETRQESYLRMLGTDPVFRLDEGSALIYGSIKFSLLARTYSIFVSEFYFL